MIEINDNKFQVFVERKRIKNIYLRIKDNALYISAPKLMSDREILRFLELKKDWIYDSYSKIQNRRSLSPMYHGGDKFCIFGKTYDIVYKTGKSKVEIDGNRIVLTYKDDDREKAIDYLYKYTNKYVLEESLKVYERYACMLNDYGYRYVPEIKVKKMRSKWGVCYVRKNLINMSSYMIHYDRKCLEYVMLHEMTHFIVPNHSKRFYQIIQNYMPDYKKYSDMLKNV